MHYKVQDSVFVSNLSISIALELKFQMDHRLNLEDVETENIRIITLWEFRDNLN